MIDAGTRVRPDSHFNFSPGGWQMLYRLISAASVAAIVSTAQAGLVLDWGGDYVTTTQSFAGGSGTVTFGNFDGDGDIDDIRRTLALTTGTPASGYSGPAFSAGFFVYGEDDTNANRAPTRQVVNNSAVDRMSFLWNSIPASPATDPSDVSAAAIVLFEKSTFTGGPGTYSFDATSALRITIDNVEQMAARFVVRDGTSYWMSNASRSMNGTLETLNPEVNTTWAPYNPGSNLNFDQSQTFVTRQFTDITAVGYYIEADLFEDINSQVQFGMNSFEVDAVIPEPASLSALVSSLLVLRRRRR
jgi:hypothetical protein